MSRVHQEVPLLWCVSLQCKTFLQSPGARECLVSLLKVRSFPSWEEPLFPSAPDPAVDCKKSFCTHLPCRRWDECSASGS